MPSEDYLRERPDGCSLAVRVQPGAKRTVILGVYEDSEQPQLKIALKAPPIDGRANEALIAFLAETLNLPRTAISIAHGETSRSKLVLLTGISKSEAQSKLS